MEEKGSKSPSFPAPQGDLKCQIGVFSPQVGQRLLTVHLTMCVKVESVCRPRRWGHRWRSSAEHLALRL